MNKVKDFTKSYRVTFMNSGIGFINIDQDATPADILKVTANHKDELAEFLLGGAEYKETDATNNFWLVGADDEFIGFYNCSVPANVDRINEIWKDRCTFTEVPK